MLKYSADLILLVIIWSIPYLLLRLRLRSSPSKRYVGLPQEHPRHA
jgi:hypothetical protein